MLPPPTTVLQSLSGLAARGREEYFRALSELPTPISRVAMQHYQQRLARVSPMPLLGECAPWLMADILSVRDVSLVTKLAGRWLHIYASTVLLDDLIDLDEHNNRSSRVVVAALLLERGVTALLGDARRPDHLRIAVDQALLDTASAAFHELDTHRHRLQRFSSAEISGLGKKVALFRICVDALVDSQLDVQVEREWISAVLTHLTCAIQLLDDIVDWEEDNRVGSFTLPLTLGHLRDSRLADVKNRQEILRTLIETGALTDALTSALHALRCTAALLTDSHGSGSTFALHYVASLIEAADEAVGVISSAAAELRNRVGTGDISSDAYSRRVLIDVESSIAVLAQGS